jgi:CheY-like chemotaxis protein
MARIMYIEDNESLRTASELLLKRKGHSVLAREDTDKAIAIASIWKPDLIITDHDLGTEETGIMFAEKVKKHGVNVAMMTGSDVGGAARRLGIPFFSKPCLITDVIEELIGG